MSSFYHGNGKVFPESSRVRSPTALPVDCTGGTRDGDACETRLSPLKGEEAQKVTEKWLRM